MAHVPDSDGRDLSAMLVRSGYTRPPDKQIREASSVSRNDEGVILPRYKAGNSGRPQCRYHPVLTPLACKYMAKCGLSLVKIASELGLSANGLRVWRLKYPELEAAIQDSSSVNNDLVERALFERATGYNFIETKTHVYKGAVVKADVVKHVPPDPASIMWYQRNRDPDRWRDRPAASSTVSVNIEIQPPPKIHPKVTTRKVEVSPAEDGENALDEG